MFSILSVSSVVTEANNPILMDGSRVDANMDDEIAKHHSITDVMGAAAPKHHTIDEGISDSASRHGVGGAVDNAVLKVTKRKSSAFLDRGSFSTDEPIIQGITYYIIGACSD